MTDNEKRAHDLAITTVSCLMNPEFLRGEARKSGDTTVSFDIYKKYMDAYSALLESFSRDFPDGE